MLTQVRQRVTQQVHGHRGRAGNDSWAYRRLLLRGGRYLSAKQWRRLQACSPPTTRPGRSRPPGPARSPCASSWTHSPRPTGRWSPAPAVTLPRRAGGEARACGRMRSGSGCAASTPLPRRPRPRARAARRHRPDLVAGDPGLPAAAGHQRPHRGLPPQDQTDQASCLRLPEPAVLRTPYLAQQRRDRGVTITRWSRPSRSNARNHLRQQQRAGAKSSQAGRGNDSTHYPWA